MTTTESETEGQVLVTEFPRVAIREIAGLCASLPRSVPADLLEYPYSEMVARVEAAPPGATRSRVVSDCCQDYGLNPVSFHAAMATCEVREFHDQIEDWPTPMGEAAYHGPMGAMARELEPMTEADPSGVLIVLIAAIGNMLGHHHFLFGGGYHHTNENVCLVGESAMARKGTCWDVVELGLRQIDADWVDNNVKAGLSTGEGLIDMVHDEVIKQTWDEDAQEYKVKVVEPNVEDKRACFWAGEFGGVLQVMSRPGVTLPSTMRDAWDGKKLGNQNKTSPRTATGAHITLITAVNQPELTDLLIDADNSNVVNGFANRFLWVLVKRSKKLPEGGTMPRASEATQAIRRSLHWASRREGPVERDEEVYGIWAKLYNDFGEDTYGIHQNVTNRGLQHIMRISLIYALMDCSPMIRYDHIMAAFEVWRYCSDSARLIFGEGTGFQVADRILDELRENPTGMTREDINEVVFNKRERPSVIRAGLQKLERYRLAYSTTVVNEDDRTQLEERWYASTRR